MQRQRRGRALERVWGRLSPAFVIRQEKSRRPMEKVIDDTCDLLAQSAQSTCNITAAEYFYSGDVMLGRRIIRDRKHAAIPIGCALRQRSRSVDIPGFIKQFNVMAKATRGRAIGERHWRVHPAR